MTYFVHNVNCGQQFLNVFGVGIHRKSFVFYSFCFYFQAYIFSPKDSCRTEKIAAKSVVELDYLLNNYNFNPLSQKNPFIQ